MARRNDGEGHVRKHKNGGYEARLYVPAKLRHIYGGKRELSFYGKTAEIAIAKRAIGQRDLDERKGTSAGQTFGVYLSRWLDALDALGAVAERTLQDYRYWARAHLIPDDKLGPVLLEDLTAEDLDLLYSRLAKEGIGPRAINHVHSTARVALQRAVKKRLIPYNPARDADPPHYSTDEREYALLSMEDVSRFFAAAAGDRFEALWVMSVLAGPLETRPYDLRHTFATLWMESGEDGKLLQRVLGHSRYETTANRYVHPSDRATGEAMSRFGARFANPS